MVVGVLPQPFLFKDEDRQEKFEPTTEGVARREQIAPPARSRPPRRSSKLPPRVVALLNGECSNRSLSNCAQERWTARQSYSSLPLRRGVALRVGAPGNGIEPFRRMTMKRSEFSLSIFENHLMDGKGKIYSFPCFKSPRAERPDTQHFSFRFSGMPYFK